MVTQVLSNVNKRNMGVEMGYSGKNYPNFNSQWF